MQVDSQKIFLSTCIFRKGYPNLKWLLQKNNAGLQIKYRRGLFHNVAMHCKNAEELMALAESEGIYARGTEPGGAGENRRMSRFIVFDCISNFV